jgi:pyridoxine 5-phosphate synthase
VTSPQSWPKDRDPQARAQRASGVTALPGAESIVPAVSPLRLGVNIDHVATVRNARGARHPDPLRAARLAVEAGADGITAHLREDRRHIRDDDIARLKAEIGKPLNLEMAATAEMAAIATKTRPHAACLVPERRQERTTEGGLDVAGQRDALTSVVAGLKQAGIRVSLFIAAEPAQIEASAAVGAPVVEIHTGAWCDALAAGDSGASDREWQRIRAGARLARRVGLEVHAGHGLDYATAEAIAALPEIVELNIGHFLIGEAMFVGLAQAVQTMRSAMDRGRARAVSA